MEDVEDPQYNFRRTISEKKYSDYYYYPINELMSSENSKIFSAVKMFKGKQQIDSTKNEEDRIDDKKYCLKWLNKKWIKKFLLTECNYKEDNLPKFFEVLRKGFDQSKNIKNSSILELYDYIEEEDGIFLVYDSFQMTLYDYIRILKEANKQNKNTGIVEYKIRPLLIKLIDSYISIIHDLSSVYMSGILNSRDIYLSISGDNVNECKIKFQNPFMSNIMAIFKVFNFDDYFPSFYPPEVYHLFSDSMNKIVDKLTNVGSLDLSNIHSVINNIHFDIWALGYLLYEILDKEPFIFKSLDEFIKTVKENYSYAIQPFLLSEDLLFLVNNSLQYHIKFRIPIKILSDKFHSYSMKDTKSLKEEEELLSKVPQKEVKISINEQKDIETVRLLHKLEKPKKDN